MRLFFVVMTIVCVHQSARCWSTAKILRVENAFQKPFDSKGIALVNEVNYRSLIHSSQIINGSLPDIATPWKIFDLAKNSNYEVFQNFPLVFEKRWGSLFHQTTFCDLDNDHRMKVIYPVAVFNELGVKIYVFNPDGSPVDGWPVEIQGYEARGVACGDVDGDGRNEVVVVSGIRQERSFLNVIKSNGKLLEHFPVELAGYGMPPSLADLDLDGKMEIAVASSYPHRVTIFRGSGKVLDGWPQPLKEVASSIVSMGDLNGDGFPEVIAEDYSHLFVWDRRGVNIEGYPFELPGGLHCSYSSPVLADINNDGFKEILFGAHLLSDQDEMTGAVIILDWHGRIVPGWPRKTDFWIYGTPTVGFMDQDNIPDIAVGDIILSPNPVNHVYAWNDQGMALKGFPYGPVNAVDSQIALANLNGQASLILNDNSQNSQLYGSYHAISYSGELVLGWPIHRASSELG